MPASRVSPSLIFNEQGNKRIIHHAGVLNLAFPFARRRHEVLAAAAAATAEAAEIGEQRCRVRRRDSQPNIGVRRAGAAQDLVDVVVDAAGRLPFAVHRYVRLDARVPAGVDAAPSRLLRRPQDRLGGQARMREKEQESLESVLYLLISD